MELRLLEVVAPVDGVKPDIQEVLGPLPVPDNEAVGRQTFLVLSYDEVYSVAFQVTEGLNHTVRRYHRCICDHSRFELGGGEERCVDRVRRVHDECVVVQVPEESGTWVKGHGMAHGRHASPRQWCVSEGVLVVVWKEGLVACTSSMLCPITSTEKAGVPCLFA